jgi:glucose/arabinose dehydrogenase
MFTVTAREFAMQAVKRFLRGRPGATAAVALLSCLLVAPAVQAQQHTPLEDPIPGLIPQSPVKVALQIVLSGLVAPVAAASAPGDPDHLYVADQVGQVWRVALNGPAQASPTDLFLDVKALLVQLGNYDERGLLGLAFHPAFQANGLFYTFTSQPVNGQADFSTLAPGTTANCQSVITEWRVLRPGDPASPVDLASARELVRIDKPQANHNGGALVFGPDRMLYVSLGDGGGANDQDIGHARIGNAQSLLPGNVLGKILRIDPLGRNSANGKYGIPTDNPMLGKVGAGEIHAYGFRNPFRMSFAPDGRLIAGDVGENSIEEIDVVTAGGNYGWRAKEGSFLLELGGTPTPDNPDGDGSFVYADRPGATAGMIDPIAEYDHSDGPALAETRVAVIGGFVYRGAQIPPLAGRYVFGDYAGEAAPTPSGHLFTLGANNQVENLAATNRDPFDLAVLGFAEDTAGELYVLANGSGTTGGTAGIVMKIVRPAE